MGWVSAADRTADKRELSLPLLKQHPRKLQQPSGITPSVSTSMAHRKRWTLEATHEHVPTETSKWTLVVSCRPCQSLHRQQDTRTLVAD
eukprot:840824-Rhodomonas_salina.4